jgi:membrane associated rhomboid family serine protease
MTFAANDQDNAPLTWVGRVPVYLTTALVAAHVCGMILVAILMATGQQGILAWLTFSCSAVVDRFAIWQFVTYAFVNQPSIWFAVEMYLLWTFGTEVEKRIGRRGFGALYLTLVLIIPIVLTGLGLAGMPQAFGGSGPIHFAVFIAFAAIYPRTQILFGLEARWIALILLGINSLQYLAGNAWIPLSMLWLECASAIFMLHRAGATGSGIFDGMSFQLPERRPSKRATVRKASGKVVQDVEAGDPYESIDPLLEKISKHGMHSLTKTERQKLEKARDILLERERRQ